MAKCKDKEKFITAEAASKAALRTRGIIDKFLNIKKLAEFRKLNSIWSKDAEARFGIKERLFFEDGEKAVPNTIAFKAIDQAKGIYYEEDDVPSSIASEETLQKVKEAAKKMGIDIQKLSDYAKNTGLDTKNINGIADLMYGIIAISEGKENIALTEEMVHIATSILEQTNPNLVTQMISKIDRFAIYKRTFEAYKNNKNYQLSNGKPDIRKIKKEAVDKLIAEVIINQSQGSEQFPELFQEENISLVERFWNMIKDFVSGMYKKANIDIFKDVASQIIEGEIGSIEQLKSTEKFYQLSSAQETFQKKILDTQNTIRKQESKEQADPMFLDTEEASNWYEVLNPSTGEWEKVKRRVTDRVKNWYNQRFRGKTFTEEEKKFNELKREIGIEGHGYFEDVHHRFFNQDGTRKTTPGDRPVIKDRVKEAMYLKVEKYFTDLIDSFTVNGQSPLVFSEIMLYDPKEKEAGTIDLLIVDSNGKANIFDWKFMSVSQKSEDIPWFKKGAFNIQLGRYKDILRDVYGVKEIGMNRAIPILLDFKRESNKKDAEILLNGITIGTVDVSKIEDLRLLPVSEKTESTGDKKIDELLSKLHGVSVQISKSEAITEEDREFKAKRLNLIEKAARLLQTQFEIEPLVEVITLIRKEGTMLVNDYEMLYKNKPADSKDLTDKQLSDFADQLREYKAVSDVFKDITLYLGKHIYNESMEDAAETEEEKAEVKARKEMFYKIIREQEFIKQSSMEINEISGQFMDKFVGQRNRETDLLTPEAVVEGLGSYFRGVSELPLKSLRILYKLVTNAKGKASRESLEDVNRLTAIHEKLKARGGDLRKLIQQIYQKDGNKLVNKLIYKYDKKFYEGLKNNSLETNRSKQWLKDNVDIEGYKAEANEILKKNIAHIKSKYAGHEETMEMFIEDEINKWDIDSATFNGWNNYVLARHPQEKWLSNEFKELQKDPDLLELYNYITEINARAKEVGYIQNKVASTFLPFVRKSMAESLAWDMDVSAVMNLGKELTIDAATVGYGSINELTGEIEHSVPKYFTHDFTDKEEASEDLFKNMIMYINHLNKYKYLTAIEGQLKMIKDIETFKDHLLTTRTGQVVMENGKPVIEKGNEKNTRLFDDFLRGVLYEEKYPLSESDVAIDTGVIDFIKKSINKVAGREVFTPSENPSAVSLMKSIDMLNRGFQLKTLGLEFISGAVNIFGGNIQMATQAGNYFKAREFAANEVKLIGNSFSNDDEREMFIQLIDKFMPLKDDPTYDLLRKSGMTSLTRANFSDMLMVFMRQPEQHLEKSVFLTLLQNMMVVDGKIISIPEFVKNKYKNRYSNSQAYHESKKAIDNEIEELKNTKSINATKKLENGKLVIPGLDLNNIEELQRLTNLTRRISRNATGGISDSDLNRASMNIWLRSMMVFKNWITKLVDTRFSSFRQISDDFSTVIDENGMSLGEKYDIGRIRLWFYVMGTSIRDKSFNVINLLEMNDKGIQLLDKMYVEFSEKYKLETGKDLNMTKEDFNDLILNNLRNQIKEVAIALSLVSAGLAMGMMTPPDDADKATKNFYRWSQRVLDKFQSELLFFYSPIQFEQMLSGGTFPALGLFTDIVRFMNHFMMETTGIDMSDPTLTHEEVIKKAKPIKYLGKMLPVTKSLMTYGAILDSDFAKEFDITVQKGNQMR